MNNHIEVTDETFEQEVLKSTIPVLVDFWAPWCAPCRMIAPTLEQIAEEYKGKIIVGKLNVDNNPQTAIKYGITGIPTLLLIKDGMPVNKLIGAVSKSKLKEMIDDSL